MIADLDGRRRAPGWGLQLVAVAHVGVALGIVVLVAGCGQDKQPPDSSAPPPARAALIELDLPAPVAGPPDGGLDQGHGQADRIVMADGDGQAKVKGRLSPSSAKVEVQSLGSGERPAVRREGMGRFRIVIPPAHAGARRYRVIATRRGWRAHKVGFRVLAR